MKKPEPKFHRGVPVFHRERPNIPGRITRQHVSDRERLPVAQYAVEWERSPLGYGKSRIEHVWAADLRVRRP